MVTNLRLENDETKTRAGNASRMKRKQTRSRSAGTMKKALRSTCMSLVVLAFYWPAGRAWSGSAPAKDSKAALQRWSHWWMNEVGQQAVPTPQLLYLIGQPSDADDERLSRMNECLHQTVSVTALYRYGFGYKNEWYQANAGLISTEAFVLPSALHYVGDEEGMGAVFLLYDYDGSLPVLCFKPPQEPVRVFHWLKHISVPARLRSTAFDSKGYGEDTLLEVNRLELSPGYQSTTLHNPFVEPREVE